MLPAILLMLPMPLAVDRPLAVDNDEKNDKGDDNHNDEAHFLY